MSNESIIHKPLKGKYDGRRFNGNPENVTHLIKSRLGHSRARFYLRAIDKVKSPIELFQQAIENKQLSLAWQIRIDMHDRAYGKPFVSINPQETKQSKPLDPKIQIAIQNLIPGADPKPKVLHGKRLRESIASQLIDNEQHADVDVT